MTGSATLVLDTSNHWCACALSVDGKLFQMYEDLGRGHAERLASMAGELLEDAKISPQSLSRVGVNIGPGSFAGTRVGVAFTRGLALSTGAKPIGVGLLPALAYQMDPECKATVLVMHDAKRGEIIWQTFKSGNAYTGLMKSDLAKIVKSYHELETPILTGSAAHMIDPKYTFDDKPPLEALIKLTELAANTSPLPSPVYVRPPDAKRPGE